MITYIFALRSRTQSMRFYERLRAEGVYARIVNTPREAAVGCGISVEIRPEDFAFARGVFSRGDFTSLIGIFRCERQGRQLLITRIDR